MKWRWAAILLAVFGGLLVIGALAMAGSVYLKGKNEASAAALIKPGGSMAVGNPAPDFQLKSLDGATFTLSSLAGTPVVINFWATWCPPCKDEMPLFEEYFTRYPGQFTILAVDLAEGEDVVRPFVEELGLTFPILMDLDEEVNSLYRIQGYPTTYFIGSDGLIKDFHVGLLSETDLKRYLRELEVIN